MMVPPIVGVPAFFMVRLRSFFSDALTKFEPFQDGNEHRSQKDTDEKRHQYRDENHPDIHHDPDDSLFVKSCTTRSRRTIREAFTKSKTPSFPWSLNVFGRILQRSEMLRPNLLAGLLRPFGDPFSPVAESIHPSDPFFNGIPADFPVITLLIRPQFRHVAEKHPLLLFRLQVRKPVNGGADRSGIGVVGIVDDAHPVFRNDRLQPHSRGADAPEALGNRLLRKAQDAADGRRHQRH